MTSEHLLASLPKIAAAGALADKALTEHVRRARSQAISWARIGEALGTTRQAAWERFSESD